MSITLVDNASPKLEDIAAAYERMHATMGQSASGMGQLSTASDQVISSLQQQSESIKTVSSLIKDLAGSMTKYFISTNAFAGMAKAWNETIAGGFEYNQQLENSRIGIAGILESITRLDGKQLEWNQALLASNQIMETLKTQAVEASLSTSDLVETFRGLLGPGIAAGMKVNEIAKFAAVGSKAVADLGLPPIQYLQELRSIISGNIRPASSTLATALGLTNQEIKAAEKRAGGLFQFLMERLEGFEAANEATQGTWRGVTTKLQNGLKMAFGEGMEPLTEYATRTVGQIADQFITLNKQTKSLEVNKQFVKDIQTISNGIVNASYAAGKTAAPFVKAAGGVGSDLLHYIAKNPEQIVATVGLYQLRKASRDLNNVADDTAHVYRATTLAGRGYQKLVDWVDGYSKAVKTADALTTGLATALNGKLFASKTGPANPVAGLAEAYQKLGAQAKTAQIMQDKVFETLATKGSDAATKLAVKFKYAAEVMGQVAKNANAINGLNLKTGDSIRNAPSTVRKQETADRSAFFDIANSKRTEDSITRVAEKLKKLGVEAQKAAFIQKTAQDMVINGQAAAASAYVTEQEKIAQGNKLQREAMDAESKRFQDEIGNLQKTAQQYEKYNSVIENIKSAAGKNGLDKETLGARATKLAEQMRAAGMSERQIVKTLKVELDAVKHKRLENIDAVEKIVEKHIEEKNAISSTNYAEQALLNTTKEYMSQDWSKMTRESKKMLEYDSWHVLNLEKNRSAVSKVTNAYNSLEKAVKQGYITEEDAGKLTISIQKTVAAGYVDQAQKIADVIANEVKRGELNSQNAKSMIQSSNAEIEARNKLYSFDKEEINRLKIKTALKDAEANLERRASQQEIDDAKKVNKAIMEVVDAIEKKGGSLEKIVPLAQQAAEAEISSNKQVLESVENQTDAVKRNMKVGRSRIALGVDAISTAGGVAVAIGGLVDAYGALTGAEDDDTKATGAWISEMGTAVWQIGTLITALRDLIPYLIKATEWLGKAAKARWALEHVSFLGGAAVAALGVEIYEGIKPFAEKGTNPFAGTYQNTQPNEGASSGWYFNPEDYRNATRENPEAPKSDENAMRMLKGDGQKTAEDWETPAERRAREMMDMANDNMNRANQILNNLSPGYDAPSSGKKGKSGRSAEAAARAAQREEERKLAELEKLAEAQKKANAEAISATTQIALQAADECWDMGQDGCVALMDKLAKKGAWGGEVFQKDGHWLYDVYDVRDNAENLNMWYDETDPDEVPEGAYPVFASSRWPRGAHIGYSIGHGQMVHNASSNGDRAAVGEIGQMGDEWLIGYIYKDPGTAPGEWSTETKAQIKATQEAAKKAKEKANAIKDTIKLTREMNEDIDKINGVPDYITQRKKNSEKLMDIAAKLSKDKSKGADISYASERLNAYSKALTLENLAQERQYTIDQAEEEQKRVDNAYKMGILTTQEHNDELDKRLEAERNYLETLLGDAKISHDERVKYEDQLTSVIEKQESRRARTLKGALQNNAQSLKDYEIDYTSMMTNIEDTFQNGMDNMFDGVVDGTTGLFNNLENAWKDLTNSIINMIWKMAMEMYVVKPLFNWLGNMISPTKTPTTGGGALAAAVSSIASSNGWGNVTGAYHGTFYDSEPKFMSSSFTNPTWETVGHNANGGYAEGWSIVGEEGPELVNFSNPGRVYTAKQTREAMGGNLENVKVEIINKSGKDVKADNANVKFDAKGAVISIVLNAVANNTYGMRDILKGAATT
jgi:hypothetical protein